jgi:hypothetical protein
MCSLLAWDSASPPLVEEILHNITSQWASRSLTPLLQHAGRDMTIDLTDATSDVEDDTNMIPSSAHVPWPLKYVKSMAKGFSKMDTMTGSLEH